MDAMRNSVSVRNGLIGFEIGGALRLKVHQFAPAHHQRHGAREVFGVDVALDQGMDSLQPLGRDSSVFGLGKRERSSKGLRRKNSAEQARDQSSGRQVERHDGLT